MSKPRINLEDPETIGLISPAHKGATRCQYGHYYDNSGTYLFTVDDEHQTAVKRGEVKKMSSRAQKAAPVAVDDNSGGSKSEESLKDFDLQGWLNGDVQAQFFTVKAAVSEQYGVAVKNKAEAQAVIKDPPEAE